MDPHVLEEIGKAVRLYGVSPSLQASFEIDRLTNLVPELDWSVPPYLAFIFL